MTAGLFNTHDKDNLIYSNIVHNKVILLLISINFLQYHRYSLRIRHQVELDIGQPKRTFSPFLDALSDSLVAKAIDFKQPSKCLAELPGFKMPSTIQLHIPLKLY